ncbi:MAG: spermidine/putrescine ABC transporter substrate-binding protein [Nocardioidaceae bacterium]|nr:spermidine/putrescine ABC transporter substrate-binding protein [Nocardioidaceae bacterium]
MAMHPRERPVYDRRRFLRNSLYVSLGTVAAPGLLSACSSTGSSTSAANTVLPLARPDDPVTLPVHDDIPAIADGMDPETGILKVFNYSDYLAPGLLKAFGEEYGVEVEVTTFNSMDEAVAKLRTGQARFDVFFPTPDILAKVVVGKLLQPINLSYLPNLSNAWPSLQDPFYDRGPLYTVPYNVYTTGIGYRADQVSDIPANGYDLLWDERYAGKIHILDDGREAIGMSLVRSGVTDVNTEDPELIRAAGTELSKLVSAVRVKVDINGYTEVPENRATVHQCWSGDMIGAQYYLPKGDTADVLGYWYPTGEPGVVGSDTIAVVAGAEHPVLAHHFLNYLLDEKNALRNFGWVGYQPALQKFTPSYLSGQGYVPANLESTVVTLDDYRSGLQLLQLSPTGRTLWDDTWATFKSG